MKRLSQFFVIAALFAVLAPVSLAGMYKWTDEDGNTVYSQLPPPEGEYERLDVRTAPPSSGQSAQGGSSAAESILQDAEESEKQKDIEAQQAKAEELRKQNCEAAKQNLQVYTVYRRVRDEQGNVKVLEDEERQKLIQEAKDQIAEFCD